MNEDNTSYIMCYSFQYSYSSFSAHQYTSCFTFDDKHPTFLEPSYTSIIAYYQIEYSYIGPCQVLNDPSTILINESLPWYTVTRLEAYSNYSFVITAANDAGKRSSDPITASTVSAGMKYFNSHISLSCSHSFSSADIRSA